MVVGTQAGTTIEPNDLLRIFYSSGGWNARTHPSVWPRLWAQIEATRILVSTAEAAWSSNTRGLHRRGDGDRHMKLKATGRAWLKKRGAKKVTSEHRMGDGRIADLFSDDLNCVVECGDTDAAKCVTQTLQDGFEFCVLPFQEEDLPMARIYRFVSAGEGAEIAYEQDRLEAQRLMLEHLELRRREEREQRVAAIRAAKIAAQAP